MCTLMSLVHKGMEAEHACVNKHLQTQAVCIEYHAHYVWCTQSLCYEK